MLAGILAAQSFNSEMIGDASLSRRPMGRVIEPLSQMGARIESTQGHAPLRVYGTTLTSIAYTPAIPSAQVKSAVILAGLHADGTTVIFVAINGTVSGLIGIADPIKATTADAIRRLHA